MTRRKLFVKEVFDKYIYIKGILNADSIDNIIRGKKYVTNKHQIIIVNYFSRLYNQLLIANCCFHPCCETVAKCVLLKFGMTNWFAGKIYFILIFDLSNPTRNSVSCCKCLIINQIHLTIGTSSTGVNLGYFNYAQGLCRA
jgi:hypothetical protein